MTMTATADRAARPLATGHRDVAGMVFAILMLLALLFSLAILGILVGSQLVKGLPVFAERGTDFLTSPLSSNPDKAGVAQGLIGTASWPRSSRSIAFPIGIVTAVYLEEYAPTNVFSRFIDINIRNLAGVPSVVYGLLGLAVFVTFFEAIGAGDGRNVLVGRADPGRPGPAARDHHRRPRRSARSRAASATRATGSGRRAGRSSASSSCRRQSPGILTGTVLALSRALGETAPLVLAGAILGSYSSGGSIADTVHRAYAALPMIVFEWAASRRSSSGPTPRPPSSCCSRSRSWPTLSPSSCATGTTADGDRGADRPHA